MAIYGVDLYAKSIYGFDIPIQFTVQPFVAQQLEYGNLHISWTTPRQVSTSTSAGKAWTSLRLVRNFYGFPVSATDGAILLEIPNTSPVENLLDNTVETGLFAYYAIFVLTIHDPYDSSRTYSIGDMVSYSGQNYVAVAVSQGQTPGSGSAWSVTTSATEWVIAGTCIGLPVADWKYSEFLYANTPRAYKIDRIETTGSNPDVNNHLWKFDRIFGFGFDIMKTENDRVRRINDIETTRDRSILCLAEQMGIGRELPDEPVLRRLRLMDAVKISRQKGSVPGLLTLISDTTGWGASVTQGYNLLLDIDQAAFAHPSPPTWDPNTRYKLNEYTRFQGRLYRANLANWGHTPDPSVIGVQPSSAVPEFWHEFKPLTVGWRGLYSSTGVYAVGDRVIAPGIDLTGFFTVLVANGPGTAAGVQAPAAGASNTWWSRATSTTDDRGLTITYNGTWASSLNYTALQSASLSPNTPGTSIWTAVASSTGSINNFWFALPLSANDNTGALNNPTVGGQSSWGGWSAVGTAFASLITTIDGVPAVGSTPARNCLQLSNLYPGAVQVAADSVWITNFVTWSAASAWVPGNVVTYNGANFQCILGTPATATTPNNDPAHWKPYTPIANEFLAAQYGVPIPRVRPWDHNRTYNPGDKVSAGGNVYQATYSTTGSSPSGYRTDSRGWRWTGPEQTLYTASLYYQRISPTGVTNVYPLLEWFGPNNTRLTAVTGNQYPVLFDRFITDGPIGGAAPGSYTAPAFGSPVPITWIDAGGPWRVDYGVAHPTYPAAHTSGQLLAMSEAVYGSAVGSDPLVMYVTLVRQSYDPTRESGLIFNLDTTARTYWMMSNTRLTKNTYNAGLTTTTITQVGASWAALPDNSRLVVNRVGTTYTGKVGSWGGTQLFSLTDSFSSTGTLHGFGERPR